MFVSFFLCFDDGSCVVDLESLAFGEVVVEKGVGVILKSKGGGAGVGQTKGVECGR